jgi:hypothetical protein
MKPEKVGEINEVVISILNLSVDPGTPILLGGTNLEHMKKRHPKDFDKYKGKIAEILEFPDYVAQHPKEDSIEYIKKYYDEEKEDYVLVAVRATANGIHFAKTLFVMADRKVEKYKEKGSLKEIKKP